MGLLGSRSRHRVVDGILPFGELRGGRVFARPGVGSKRGRNEQIEADAFLLRCHGQLTMQMARHPDRDAPAIVIR